MATNSSNPSAASISLISLGRRSSLWEAYYRRDQTAPAALDRPFVAQFPPLVVSFWLYR
jgi:hypothetical protein